MKRFLIIQARPEDEAADDEYQAFLRFGGLAPADVERVRIEKTNIEKLNLEDYSGVIVGGTPFCVSDPEPIKTATQKRVERELFALMREIVEKDFPYMGNCYGLGILAQFLEKDVVSNIQYGEGLQASPIKLLSEAKNDPLLKSLPSEFKAFVGHKEAVQTLPRGAVHLASAEACPYEMIRVKKNVYGVQFHTELDSNGLELRIRIYKNAGYFPPETADELIAKGHEETVTAPQQILRNFVERYRA